MTEKTTPWREKIEITTPLNKGNKLAVSFEILAQIYCDYYGTVRFQQLLDNNGLVNRTIPSQKEGEKKDE